MGNEVTLGAAEGCLKCHRRAAGEVPCLHLRRVADLLSVKHMRRARGMLEVQKLEFWLRCQVSLVAKISCKKVRMCYKCSAKNEKRNSPYGNRELHLYANAHLPNCISEIIGWIHGTESTTLTSVRDTSVQESLKTIKLDVVIWRISAEHDEIRSLVEVPGHRTPPGLAKEASKGSHRAEAREHTGWGNVTDGAASHIRCYRVSQERKNRNVRFGKIKLL